MRTTVLGVLMMVSFAIAGNISERGDSIKEFSVCQLMSQLKSQRHRVVRLRGELYSGGEITALGSSSCAKPFATHGLRWPAAVDLVFSDYQPSDKEPPAPFITETTARERLASAARAAMRMGSTGKVLLTVTGFLRVRPEYVRMSTGYGPQGNGYGHLGAYPAQLVIKTVDDVRINQSR